MSLATFKWTRQWWWWCLAVWRLGRLGESWYERVGWGEKSVVALTMNNTLDRVTSPVFAFDRYDAVITSTDVYILDKNAFEGLFKESNAVLAKTTDWIKEVAKSIPMAEGSAEALEATLKQNQFLGRKFLAVKQRPHIKTMTSDTLTTEIDRHGQH